MALEPQVGFVMAVLGLGGCLLFLVEGRIRRASTLWVGLFSGVLAYLIAHDLAESLLVEPFVRIALGSFLVPGEVASLSLIALGVLLGWFTVTTILARGPKSKGSWTPFLAVIALLMALHAAIDGVVIGDSLRFTSEEQVVAPAAIGLQAVHRFLEGGVMVTAMLLAGVRKARIFAVTFYVSLPLAVTTPWALYTTYDVISSGGLVLAFALVSGFITFLVNAGWAALSKRIDLPATARWVLLGFFIALVAHNLAHIELGL